MRTERRRDLPARLEGLRGRFERWRRTRKVRSWIPEPLWVSAVKAAGTYGMHRTARALRVDYYALKKRVEGVSVAEKRARGSAWEGGPKGVCDQERRAREGVCCQRWTPMVGEQLGLVKV